MKRIIVLGPSGAGKSTLAAALAVKLGLPYTELDSLFHLGNWEQVETSVFRRQVMEVTARDGWVICGNYISRLGLDYLRRADTVIWLDYPFPLVFGRLMRRTLHRAVTRQLLWNGNRESLLNFTMHRNSIFRHLVRSWNKQKKRYEPLFEDAGHLSGMTMIRLKKPAEAARLLRSVNSS